jgi:hypothetical protein
MILGSTQPLTEVSTRNIPGDKGRPVRKAYNLTAICVNRLSTENAGASTYHKLIGLDGLLQE